MTRMDVLNFNSFNEYMTRYIQFMNDFTEEKAKEIWPDWSYNGENHFWIKYLESKQDPFEFLCRLDNISTNSICRLIFNLDEEGTFHTFSKMYIYYIYNFSWFDAERLWPNLSREGSNIVWDKFNSVNRNLSLFYTWLSMENRQILYNDIIKKRGS